MTKWMITALASMALAACSDDDTNPNTSRRDAGATTQGLSTAFSENCARCHGDTGLGTQFYPRLPGGRDEAGYISVVRNGVGEMPKFSSAEISDADLRADYLWLTTKR